MPQDREKEPQPAWLDKAAVWLSAISMLAYFASSHGIKNHVWFLLQSLEKVLEKGFPG